MIFSSNHSIVIYTNHDASSNIVFQIKLTFNNTNKLNMKLIQTFIYFFQFKLKIHHRINYFNLVSDALNQLFIKNTRVNSSNNLNLNNYFIKSTIDIVYIFNQTMMTINDEFRIKIIEDYQKNKTYKKLLFTFCKLVISIKKNTSNKFVHTKINFVLQNKLIYYVRNNKKKLCILTLMKKIMLKTAHDDCNYAKHHHAYVKLSKMMYIHKLSRKLIIYIKHYSAYQLNQIRRHK